MQKRPAPPRPEPHPRWAAAAAIAVASLTGAAAPAAPEPAPVPERWQLDLRPNFLRIAVVADPSLPDAEPRAFFYLTYEVVNNSDRDLMFAPTWDLAAEDGSLVRSGRDIPPEVTAEIGRRLRNPYLLDQIGMATEGTFLRGEENARLGFVVWPAENLKVDDIVIFAGGFSGETRTVFKPDTGEEVVLRKTLMLRHEAPGELAALGDRPIKRSETRWIMR